MVKKICLNAIKNYISLTLIYWFFFLYRQYRHHPGLPSGKIMLAPEPPELPPLEVIKPLFTTDYYRCLNMSYLILSFRYYILIISLYIILPSRASAWCDAIPRVPITLQRELGKAVLQHFPFQQGSAPMECLVSVYQLLTITCCKRGGGDKTCAI